MQMANGEYVSSETRRGKSIGRSRRLPDDFECSCFQVFINMQPVLGAQYGMPSQFSNPASDSVRQNWLLHEQGTSAPSEPFDHCACASSCTDGQGKTNSPVKNSRPCTVNFKTKVFNSKLIWRFTWLFPQRTKRVTFFFNLIDFTPLQTRRLPMHYQYCTVINCIISMIFITNNNLLHRQMLKSFRSFFYMMATSRKSFRPLKDLENLTKVIAERSLRDYNFTDRDIVQVRLDLQKYPKKQKK